MVNPKLIAARLAVAFACVTLAGTIALHRPWKHHDQSPATTVSKSPASDSGASTAAEQPDFAEISDWHLFGVIEAEPVVEQQPEPEPPEVDLSAIPETQIPLRLSGIAYAQDQDQAFAIIVTPDGLHSDYRVGDRIGDDATVHLVEAHRVVINRNGNFEAIRLPDDTEAATSRTPRTVRAPRRAVRRPSPAVRQPELDDDDEQDPDFDPEA